MPRFLERRSLMGMLKWFVGTWCAMFGIYGVLVQFSVHGPTAPWQRIVLASLALTAFYAAIRWPSATWPTERRSLWFVVWAESSLTIGILCVPSGSGSPLVGSGLFIVTGIYVTLLHSSRIVVLHLVWAMTTIAAATALQLVVEHSTELPLLAARVLILGGLLTLIPAILHAGLQFLKEDADGSHHDPLTALLNRRGLAAEARRLLASDRTETEVIATVLIDLDGFKSLNDRHGHAGGDHALRAAAARLTEAVPETALVARLGGDEFAAIVTASHTDIDTIVTALHDAVHCRNDLLPVTASTGAWIRSGPLPVLDPCAAFARELHQADLAMYEAKNSGGNRPVCHCSYPAKTTGDGISRLGKGSPLL